MINAKEPEAKRLKCASSETLHGQAGGSAGLAIIPREPAFVNPLPDELTSFVLSFLSIVDHIVSLPTVCIRFRDLIKLPVTWPPTLSLSSLGTGDVDRFQFCSI